MQVCQLLVRGLSSCSLSLCTWHVFSCCSSIPGVQAKKRRCVALQANWLKAQGIQKGDAVAIYMPMLCELPISMVRHSAQDQPYLSALVKALQQQPDADPGVFLSYGLDAYRPSFSHGLYAAKPHAGCSLCRTSRHGAERVYSLLLHIVQDCAHLQAAVWSVALEGGIFAPVFPNSPSFG